MILKKFFFINYQLLKKVCILLGLLFFLPKPGICNLDLVSGISGAIQDAVISNVVTSKGDSISATIHKTALKVSNLLDPVTRVSVSSNGTIIVLRFNTGEIRLWNLQTGNQTAVSDADISDNDTVIPLNNSVNVLLIHKSGEVILKNIFNKKYNRKLGHCQQQIYAAAVSPDGSKLLCSGKNNKVLLIDLNIEQFKTEQANATALQEFSIREISVPNKMPVSSMAFSLDNRFFAIGGKSGSITVHDVNTGKMLYEYSMDNSLTRLIFYQSLKGDIHLAGSDKNGLLKVWNLGDNSPSMLWQKNATGSAVNAIGVGHEKQYLAVGDKKGNVVIVNAITGEKHGKLNLKNRVINFVKPVNNGSMVLTIGDNGEISINDITTKSLVLRGVSTKNGWAVIDTRGRFDGSEDALPDVRWIVKDFNLDLDKFSKVYYEPGLLTKYVTLNIPFISQGTFNVSEGIALPPTIHKFFLLNKSRDVNILNQVIITAKNIGGKVEDIELFHNDKRVSSSSIIVDKENTEKDNINVRAMAYNIQPVPGVNVFRAVGIGLGGIEGPSKILSETFQGVKKQAVLHVIAVGINKYKLSKLNLSYAAQDAKAMAACFKDMDDIYDSAEITQIFDSEATRENLIEKIKSATQATTPSDTLVIYLAGHGIISDKKWLFLSHDLNGVTNQDFSDAGISTEKFHKILLETPAQKIVVLIDSCHSGKAITRFDQFLSRRLHRSLGRSTGIGVFTASRADQNALESKTLGHGIFTYTILTGFSGKADIHPLDNKISVKEIIDFSKILIPTYSLNYLKEPQIPVAFRKGADFYINQYQ